MLLKEYSAGILALSLVFINISARGLSTPADAKPAEHPAPFAEQMRQGIISETETGISVVLMLNKELGTEISSTTAKDCFEFKTLIERLGADNASAAKATEDMKSAGFAGAGSSQAAYISILKNTLESLKNFSRDQTSFPEADRARIFAAAEALHEAIGETTLNNMDRQMAEEELRSAKKFKEAGKLENNAECLLHTAELTQALSDYKAKNGKCPENLNLLVPGHIKKIPAIDLPGHAASRAVRVIDEDFQADISSAVKDTGGWLYFSNPKSRYYCVVTPNCSHKDSDGKAFYTIGAK